MQAAQPRKPAFRKEIGWQFASRADAKVDSMPTFS